MPSESLQVAIVTIPASPWAGGERNSTPLRAERVVGSAQVAGEQAQANQAEVAARERARRVAGRRARLELRQVEEDPGNGRLYEVSFAAEEEFGAFCNGAIRVCVPVEKVNFGQSSISETCQNDGLAFSSL